MVRRTDTACYLSSARKMEQRISPKPRADLIFRGSAVCCQRPVCAARASSPRWRQTPFPLTPALSPRRGRTIASRSSRPTRSTGRILPWPCAVEVSPSPWGEAGVRGNRCMNGRALWRTSQTVSKTEMRFQAASMAHCFGRVAWSCSQATSGFPGDLNQSLTSPLSTSGGVVRGSRQRLISECPSAKENPQARW